MSAPESRSRLDDVVVVLFEPLDPVNIGGTVRAMKNMGVSQLRLVRPVEYDPYRIEGIAHGTGDLIAKIRHFDDFDSAIADCVFLAGFTARRRAAKWRIVQPREAAAEVLDALEPEAGPAALVFGREDSGLPNDILDRMHVSVNIPTTNHASLNLAQAVLLGLYELHLAVGDATRRVKGPRKHAPPPSAEMFEMFYADAARSLEAIQFFKTRNQEQIMRSLRSLMFRAAPDSRELSLVRAMFIEIRRYLMRNGIPVAAPIGRPADPPPALDDPSEP